MTLRELFVADLIAMFQGVADFPAKVERSLSVAFERKEGRVLVVHRGGELPERTLSGVTYRKSEIRFSVITRARVPDADADAVMEVAHPLIMAFSAPSLLQVMEVRTDEPKFANADGQ